MSEREIFFVTGVGRGLGRTLALHLLQAGHRVFGSTRSGTCDVEVEGCVAMQLDDAASVHAGATEVAELVDRVDVLVNCAGTDARAFGAADQQRGPFDVDAASFNAVFATNVTGPMVLTTALLPQLRAGRNPLVLNVSSQLGSMEVAATIGRDTAYCVSKAGLNMLTVKSAAALRSDGVAVVALHPGWVQTDMGGPSAALTVDESAGAIVATMAGLGPADSGRFVRWDGTDHPW
ncbi:MAG: SDR family NAD(P)-dependent oxidoreductase [Actinomycetota bacterium]